MMAMQRDALAWFVMAVVLATGLAGLGASVWARHHPALTNEARCHAQARVWLVSGEGCVSPWLFVPAGVGR